MRVAGMLDAKRNYMSAVLPGCYRDGSLTATTCFAAFSLYWEGLGMAVRACDEPRGICGPYRHIHDQPGQKPQSDQSDSSRHVRPQSRHQQRWAMGVPDRSAHAVEATVEAVGRLDRVPSAPGRRAPRGVIRRLVEHLLGTGAHVAPEALVHSSGVSVAREAAKKARSQDCSSTSRAKRRKRAAWGSKSSTRMASWMVDDLMCSAVVQAEWRTPLPVPAICAIIVVTCKPGFGALAKGSAAMLIECVDQLLGTHRRAAARHRRGPPLRRSPHHTVTLRDANRQP
jgi:hypothetical protein